MSHSYFRCCCWHIVFTALYSDSQQIVLRSSSETLTAKTQEEEILVSVLLSQNCFPPMALGNRTPILTHQILPFL